MPELAVTKRHQRVLQRSDTISANMREDYFLTTPELGSGIGNH